MKTKNLSLSLFKQNELNRKQLNTIYGGGETGGTGSSAAQTGSGSGGGKEDTNDGSSATSRG